MKVLREGTVAKSIQSTLDLVVQKDNRAITSPTWILVPDRATLEVERALLDKRPCLLNVRVVTFSMLYNIISAEQDVLAPILDKTQAVLFMWRAIESVRGELKWFGRVAHHYSFAEKMFNTINQLSSSLVDFEKLSESARTELTKLKMADIALIWRAYRDLTRDFTDTGGMLGYLIKNISESSLVKSAKVFMCGFDHLSIQRLAVVKELGAHAKLFVIGLRQGSELDAELGGAYMPSKLNNFVPIEILKHKDAQEEAANLANIVRGLLNGGVLPSDIVVLLCDYDGTRQIFADVFTQCSVPLNMDVGYPLSQTQLLIFIRGLLSLAHHDTVENFLTIIKGAFVQIPNDELFKIEAEAIKTNRTDYSAFHVLSDAVTRLKKTKKISGIVKEIGYALDTFVPEIMCPDSKKVYEISVDKLRNILTAMDGQIGDKKISLLEFSDLLQTIASATKVSTIPTFAGRVMLGNLQEFQATHKPYVFIAGTNDSTFPIIQSDTDILTEHDIKNTKQKIEPTASMQNARARQSCVNIMQGATAKIHIGHVATNSANEEVGMSDIVEKLLPCRGDAPSPANTAGLDINSRWYAMQKVLSAIGDGRAFRDPVYYSSILQSLGEEFPIMNLPRVEENLENSAQLFFPNKQTSVTTLETFFACPYMNFLTRGLKLSPRKRYRVGADIIGNIIHKICELYTAELINTKKEICPSISTKIIDQVLQSGEFSYFAKNPINKPLVEGLKKEVEQILRRIKNDIDEGEFKPKFVEKSLGDKMGETIYVRGKVDRIDTAVIGGREHALVVDYKTGSNVTYAASEIAAGTKLQLPLYLSFIANEGYTPAGAVYYPLSGGFSKDLRPRGITLGTTEEKISASIETAKEQAKRAICGMVAGEIGRKPSDKKVCRYCINRALCLEVRK